MEGNNLVVVSEQMNGALLHPADRVGMHLDFATAQSPLPLNRYIAEPDSAPQLPLLTDQLLLDHVPLVDQAMYGKASPVELQHQQVGLATERRFVVQRLDGDRQALGTRTEVALT